MINTQNDGEGTEAPSRRDLAQQTVLPRPSGGKQLAADFFRQVGRKLGTLPFDRRLNVPNRRKRLVQPPPAALQGLGRQIEKVCPANSRRGRPGELPHEQIGEPGEFALRPAALPGVCQRGERVDEEDVLVGQIANPPLIRQVGNLPRTMRFQAAPPVIANVGIAIGVGLHEHQSRARRGRRQFIGHAARCGISAAW